MMSKQNQYQYAIPEATNEEEKEQSDFNGMNNLNASIAERFARTNMYLNMEIAKEEEEYDEEDDDSYGNETPSPEYYQKLQAAP